MGMATDMIRGNGLPGVYPPLFPAALALVADTFTTASPASATR